MNAFSLKVLCIAAWTALFFTLPTRSVTAQSSLLVRLYHDQDTSASVTAADMPASGIAVTVTEECSGQVCAAAPVAYIATTDAQGYVSLPLTPGVQYNIEAPCLALSVVASEVSGQGVQEMTTCLQGMWLPILSVSTS